MVLCVSHYYYKRESMYVRVYLCVYVRLLSHHALKAGLISIKFHMDNLS